MAQVLVVADDLTGANAAAAGFARAGLRSVTASAAARPDVVAEMVARFDVVVASTDSRHADPGTARERVAAVVRAGWPARLVCNRIDTTLRGNVGASTQAVLQEVSALTGGRAVALLAPAHPSAGRQTIGGMQLLEGRRLEETELARDARSPMRTSDIEQIINSQAGLVTGTLPLSEVTGTREELVAAIRAALATEVDVLVVDATTEDHLDRVAAAAVEASAGSGVTWVTTDPGPASVAMARALGLSGKSAGAPLLAVSGSATELTRTQLRQLGAERQTVVRRTPRLTDSALPDVDATASTLDKMITDSRPGDVLVLATTLEDSDLLPVTPAEAEEIPRALARAVRRNLEMHTVDGIFCTGGDVTAALLAELGAHGLEVSEEVVPLAVAGTLVGGPWDGLHVVTKGGLVGDGATTVACIDHLRRDADLYRRQVASALPRNPF